MNGGRVLIAVLFTIISLAPAAQAASADPVTVEIYRGHGTKDGGAPFTNQVGTFRASEVMFGRDYNNRWDPCGLADFGAKITGTLWADADATYTFTLTSDDGSVLLIDGDVVITIPGLQPYPWTKTGNKSLAAGWHSAEIQFFKGAGNYSCLDLPLPPGVHWVVLADLVANWLQAPSSLCIGQSFQARWRVLNSGNGDATGPWQDSLYLSDDENIGGDLLLASFPCDRSTLASGGSYTPSEDVPVPTTVKEGRKWLIVRADSGDGVHELSEKNNYFLFGPIDVLTTPSIRSMQDARIPEHEPYTSARPALEAGGSSATWSLVNPPQAGLRIDSSTGVVSWNNPVFSANPYKITIQARTACGSAQVSWTLRVVPGYTVREVKANVDPPLAGSPITFEGQATGVSDKQEVAKQETDNVDVAIRIQVKGTERTIMTRTDGSGHFRTAWQPLARESGQYFVFASHPQAPTESTQTDFKLFGADLEPNVVSPRIVVGSSIQGSATLTNLGDMELSNLSAQAMNVAGGLTVTPHCPQSLGRQASGTLAYEVTAASTAATAGAADVAISNADGELTRLHIQATVVPLAAALMVAPGTLTAGTVPNQQTSVDFQVTNVGGSPTGDLMVSLPADIPWMSLATPVRVPSLDAGQSATVTLLLTPSQGMAPETYNGKLTVANTQVAAAVPFSFNRLEQAAGSLKVTTVDEFTFYDPGKLNVAGARVTVLDPQTRKVVAAADANESGVALFPSLPPAYYEIEVAADGHSTFGTTLRIDEGRQTLLMAFLPRRLLRYQWQVSPTEVKDRYQFGVKAVFDTDVPLPVVTIDPLMKDLCSSQEQTSQVIYTIRNLGRSAAKDVRLVFRNFGEYEFTPLVDQLGDLAPNSTREVPVLVHRGSSPCSDCNQCGGNQELTYHLPCGVNDLVYTVPFYTQACGSVSCWKPTEPPPPSPAAPLSYVDYAGTPAGPAFSVRIEWPLQVDSSQPFLCPTCDARMRLQVDRDKVLTRESFTAILEVQNNSGTRALDKLTVALALTDAQGQAREQHFHLDPPVLQGIADLNGHSSLGPGQSLTAQWRIGARPQPAGDEPQRYHVGGTLSYEVGGESHTMSLSPASITVLPSPQLEVKYFLERDVFSDDPSTNEVEPAVPFSLGLMMSNHGAGTAEKVEIVSVQPRIVDNDTGLLIDFQIIGAQVGAAAVAPSLKVTLGDSKPNECRVARWLMQSTRPGRFVACDVNYVHVDALGDTRLSSVEQASVHDLAHVVRATYPDDDGIVDFLTNDVNGPNDPLNLPDTVHLSSTCSTVPVTALVYGPDRMTSLSDNFEVTVQVADAPQGYFYARWPAPASCDLQLLSATRSDGKQLLIDENAWVTHRTVHQPGLASYEEHLVHLFDDGGPWDYKLVFVVCGPILDLRTTPGGTVEPCACRYPVCPPRPVDVVARPDPGYCFIGWTGSAVVNGYVRDPTAPNTTVTAKENCVLQANFRPFPVLAVTSGEGGSVEKPGLGALPYPCGSVVPVQAAPAPHYCFTGWTGTAVDMGKVEDPKSLETSVTMDDDYTLVACFQLCEGKLTISSTPGGKVTKPGTGTLWYPWYPSPQSVSLSAQPEPDYYFTGWTGTAVDQGKVRNPKSPDTTVLADGDYTLCANFAHVIELAMSLGDSVTRSSVAVYWQVVNQGGSVCQCRVSFCAPNGATVQQSGWITCPEGQPFEDSLGGLDRATNYDCIIEVRNTTSSVSYSLAFQTLAP